MDVATLKLFLQRWFFLFVILSGVLGITIHAVQDTREANGILVLERLKDFSRMTLNAVVRTTEFVTEQILRIPRYSVERIIEWVNHSWEQFQVQYISQQLPTSQPAFSPTVPIGQSQNQISSPPKRNSFALPRPKKSSRTSSQVVQTPTSSPQNVISPTASSTTSTTPSLSTSTQQAIYGLSISKSGTGSGTVVSNIGGINCGGTCSAALNRGTIVTLTASPSADSSFAGWGAACSGIGLCTVTMNSAQTITATFTFNPPVGREDPLAPEGFGAATQGGAGGRVIYVTTLNPTGPGSITEAIAASGPRIVKFSVGGEIRIPDASDRSNSLWIGGVGAQPTPPSGGDNPESYLTIDGASAPDPGITFTNGKLFVLYGIHDVIIRHITVRTGQLNSETGRGISINGAWNVLVDHVTLTDAEDEEMDVWGGAHDITVQWSILGPGAKCCHPKGSDHSAAFLMGNGSTRVTLHHNVMPENYFRNPILGGDGASIADVRNNVMYNNYQNTQLTGGISANLVGNLYLKPVSYLQSAVLLVETYPQPAKAYTENNIAYPPYPYNNFFALDLSTSTVTTDSIQGTSYNIQLLSVPIVATQSAAAAASLIVNQVGARPWARASRETNLMGEISSALSGVSAAHSEARNVRLAGLPFQRIPFSAEELILLIIVLTVAFGFCGIAFRVRLE